MEAGNLFLGAENTKAKLKQIACQRALSIISSCRADIIHFLEETYEEITT